MTTKISFLFCKRDDEEALDVPGVDVLWGSTYKQIKFSNLWESLTNKDINVWREVTSRSITRPSQSPSPFRRLCSNGERQSRLLREDEGTLKCSGLKKRLCQIARYMSLQGREAGIISKRKKHPKENRLYQHERFRFHPDRLQNRRLRSKSSGTNP